jgi:hypothetical protein
MARSVLQAWFGRPEDAPRAWFLLAANLVALPGLGSFLGGRRATGVAQALLATTGAGLTLVWMAEYVGRWIATGSYPLDDYGPRFAWALGGLGLFGIAWLWALRTGLAMLAEARGGGERTRSRSR